MNLMQYFACWLLVNVIFAAFASWSGYRREIIAFLRHPIRTIRRA